MLATGDVRSHSLTYKFQRQIKAEWYITVCLWLTIDITYNQRKVPTQSKKFANLLECCGHESISGQYAHLYPLKTSNFVVISGGIEWENYPIMG